MYKYKPVKDYDKDKTILSFHANKCPDCGDSMIRTTATDEKYWCRSWLYMEGGCPNGIPKADILADTQEPDDA